MAQGRQDIEAFVRQLVAEVEAAEAAGMTAPQAIAEHFNAKGRHYPQEPALDQRACVQVPWESWRPILPLRRERRAAG